MKDIKVGVEKMTRNRRKMIEKTADSLLLSKHSIQFSALFLLLSATVLYIVKCTYVIVRGICNYVFHAVLCICITYA